MENLSKYPENSYFCPKESIHTRDGHVSIFADAHRCASDAHQPIHPSYLSEAVLLENNSFQMPKVYTFMDKLNIWVKIPH